MRVRREAMSATTQCPACNTRFKVTQAQLDAHQGLVRCGRCQAVFNATEYLQDDQPSSQLELYIAPEETRPVPVLPPVVPATATPEEYGISPAEAASPEPQDTDRLNIEKQGTAHQNKVEPEELVTLAQKITFADSSDVPFSAPIRKKIVWPWFAGSMLVLIILLAQSAYFFRIELSANLPGLKPALISYCRLLRCDVPLPQKADAMSIESSDLEANPAQSGVIALNALLRNHASYAQAYPNLELTLTDAQDKPLARRTFRPVEYLKPEEDEKQGLATNRELSVKINLDTTDLKPAGYRLFLFYPQ